ncbi:hypothetical protein G9A89_017419 [Geosiphon pyriformis]|nr:hypothetical protein G9A89_017419 [Geosiphon pyriformis]
MAYAPITKLDNFTGKKDDAQIWLNNVEKAITANRWNDAQAIINRLVNVFTTIKQGETEAVTTYLGRFHQNLCQIQAIDVNYFTAPQILNQFIYGLRSSILQYVWSLHPGTLQDTVTRARDFEFTESEANHTQAVNLVMNKSSELDSKLEKFSESINKRLEGYLADNHAIYQPSQRRNNQKNSNRGQNQPFTPENTTFNNTKSNQHISTNTIPLATISSNKSLAVIFPFKLEKNAPILLFSGAALEKKPITAIYTDARVDGHPIKLILDSGSAGSIITRQLMEQLGRRVDRAASARIITANGATKTPIGEIDDFPFEVNGIVTPIKVLVMEATQYQALVGNNWLSKVNAMLDWNTQELQLTY